MPNHLLINVKLGRLGELCVCRSPAERVIQGGILCRNEDNGSATKCKVRGGVFEFAPGGNRGVIDPVVAESPADARTLIEAAIARLGSAFVRVDTSATSQLGAWLEDIGLKPVGDATTMILGTQSPSAGPARMFALANQSFS